MARYLLVAGVDFGTSFTKVVLRDNNQRGSNAVVVRFPNHPDGLLPSHVGISDRHLTPATFAPDGNHVPYPKMLAAHVAAGQPLHQLPIRTPSSLQAFQAERSDLQVCRDLLAYYFAGVMSATEAFIRDQSPWRDFSFGLPHKDDHLIYQLAVPSGLYQRSGASERLFREAFIAGYQLKGEVDPCLDQPTPYDRWSRDVAAVLKPGWAELESRHPWQCLLYPEVAAAVQTIFRSPGAPDGLHLTMDVGAGTVDLNAFRRVPKTKQLDYYAARVCPLGVQNLHDPHGVMRCQGEMILMGKLRWEVQNLFDDALVYQPNHGERRGGRTWDEAYLYIFGGGSNHIAYKPNFEQALRSAGLQRPWISKLPPATDLKNLNGVEFGRFAVAYGLSFFRPNLDQVRLPHQMQTFRELCPEQADADPYDHRFTSED